MDPAFGLRVIYRGEDRGFYPLPAAPVSLGRGLANSADIEVDEPAASGGRHFLIDWDEQARGHRLQNFGHPNQIRLNDAVVEKSSLTPLHAGDRISLGESVFRIEAIPPGTTVRWPERRRPPPAEPQVESPVERAAPDLMVWAMTFGVVLAVLALLLLIGWVLA